MPTPPALARSPPSMLQTSRLGVQSARFRDQQKKSSLRTQHSMMRAVKRAGFRLGTIALLMTVSWPAAAQGPLPQVFPADVQPTNVLANPYTITIDHFGVLYDRVWGATSAVAIDRDGKSLWVGDRCGAKPLPAGPNSSPFTSDSCAGSNLDPILEFDHLGKLVKHFGGGMFIFLHGIFVDRDGNVWVTDERTATAQELQESPAAKGKGLTVVKFSPDGKVLMTLGTPGVGGDPPNAFQAPTSVLVAPNGDIFVADGHGGPGGPGSTTSRIVKFDKNGKFIKTFGTLGHGTGQLYHPHSLAMDSAGRLYVADRSNFRIAIFDQDGNWIDAWYQFSRPSGVYIDKDDLIYVGDSESNAVQDHYGWERGVRIGSVKDGKVRYLIPDTRKGKVTSGSGPEGVTVDDQGNVYCAQVGQQDVVKYIPYNPDHQ
jgi:sugar lactone lactonase YvrE